MKTPKKINPLWYILILISCNSNYFDKPLPIDSKVISEFPGKIRGQWLVCGETSTAWDTLIIEKYSFKIKSSDNKLVKLSKREVDTSGSYCLTPAKIYEINKNHLIGEGSRYTIRQDTIYFTHIEEFKTYELNRECTLKRAGKYLIANIKGEDNNFWIPILLQKDNKGGLIARIFSPKELEPLLKMSRLKQIYANGQNFYFETQLTEKDIINIIDNNGFIDTLSVWKSMGKH